MTLLPDWLQLTSDGITAAGYDELPEDVCRRIEIVDGAVVVLPAPRRHHQILVRRLAGVIESHCEAGLAVATGVDLRIREAPLLNRRPDIVLFDASIPDDQVLRPEDCRLVVEVMSSTSVTADRLDKPAECSAAGIEHFWRVENQVDPARIQLFRHEVSRARTVYELVGIDEGAVAVARPVVAEFDLRDLA